MKKLTEIQNELKAPKDKTNKFGGYQYRNLDSILEAVKPLLKKHGCTLTFSDEVVEIGGHNYIKATARFSDGENVIENTAFARESMDRKGMSSEQMTGSASSYSRKYCAQGIFLIDDSEMEPVVDPDSLKPEEEKPKAKAKSTQKPVLVSPTEEQQPEENLATQEEKDRITALCREHGIGMKQLAADLGIKKGQMTKSQYNKAIAIINEVLDKEDKK